ncbi:YitT family protein, partial [Bacillus thuringiensis]
MYRLLGVIFGSVITALSFNLFLVPHEILSSGISGVAIIIGILTPFNIGMVNFLLNLPIL